MKKKIITAVMLTIVTGAYSQSSGGVMFSNAALKEYGIKKFNSGHPALDILTRSIKREVGKIESDTIIDTELEAAIALWLASSENSKTLPRNALGAKRLCFDLFVRIAEYPDNRQKYIDAVNLVLTMAKDTHGVTVTFAEARQFYATAMAQKINALPLGAPLTAAEQKKAKELLIAYMVEPNERNAKAFRDFKAKLNFENTEKGNSIIRFIDIISSRVTNKLA